MSLRLSFFSSRLIQRRFRCRDVRKSLTPKTRDNNVLFTSLCRVQASIRSIYAGVNYLQPTHTGADLVLDICFSVTTCEPLRLSKPPWQVIFHPKSQETLLRPPEMFKQYADKSKTIPLELSFIYRISLKLRKSPFLIGAMANCTQSARSIKMAAPRSKSGDGVPAF